MRKIFLTFCILLYTFSLSQEFKYSYTVTEKINNTEVVITFNTLDGIYRDLYCMDGEILDNYYAQILLTAAEKMKIFNLIEQYKINGLEYCNAIPDKKLKSSVFFEVSDNSTEKECADLNQVYKITELQKTLLDIIRTKPEYKKVFYWEFISK